MCINIFIKMSYLLEASHTVYNIKWTDFLILLLLNNYKRSHAICQMGLSKF